MMYSLLYYSKQDLKVKRIDVTNLTVICLKDDNSGKKANAFMKNDRKTPYH